MRKLRIFLVLIALLIGQYSLVAQELAQVAEQPIVTENRSFWTTQHTHIARRFKTMRQNIRLPKKINVQKIGKNIGIVVGTVSLAVAAAFGLPYAYKKIAARLQGEQLQPEPTNSKLPEGDQPSPNTPPIPNSDLIAQNNSTIDSILTSQDQPQSKSEEVSSPEPTSPFLDPSQLPPPVIVEQDDIKDDPQAKPASSFAQQLAAQRGKVNKRDWGQGTVRGGYVEQKQQKMKEQDIKNGQGRTGITPAMLQQQKKEKNIKFTINASKLKHLEKDFKLSNDQPQLAQPQQNIIDLANRKAEELQQKNNEVTTTDQEWDDADTNAFSNAEEKALADQLQRLQEQKKREEVEAVKRNTGFKKELTKEQLEKIEQDRDQVLKEQAEYFQKMRSQVREGEEMGTVAFKGKGSSKGKPGSGRKTVFNVFDNAPQ